MTRKDLASALGAGIVVALFAVLGVTATFGPEALGGLFGQAGAAWVQAIGSVGAIFVAIWVSRSRERRDEIHAGNLSTMFQVRVVLALDKAQLACDALDQEQLQLAVAVLKDAQRTGYEIPLSLIPGLRVHDVLDLQEISAQALLEMEAALKWPRGVGYVPQMKDLERSLTSMSQRAKWLGAHRLPMPE